MLRAVVPPEAAIGRFIGNATRVFDIAGPELHPQMDKQRVGIWFCDVCPGPREDPTSPDWRLEFTAPNGGPLQVGKYLSARRCCDGDKYGMNLQGLGKDNTEVFAKFAVWEFETNGKEIVRLAIDFAIRNGFSTAPAYGSVRINSSVACPPIKVTAVTPTPRIREEGARQPPAHPPEEATRPARRE
jgi:hypothetical protein